MSSDQIDKLDTVLESMVLPTGAIESNVSMTRPRLTRHDDVESNIEAGSSNELSLRHNLEYSPPHNTTAMLGNDSIDYNHSAGENRNLRNKIQESEKLQTIINNLSKELDTLRQQQA